MKLVILWEEFANDNKDCLNTGSLLEIGGFDEIIPNDALQNIKLSALLHDSQLIVIIYSFI